jgi:hypothetical protein
MPATLAGIFYGAIKIPACWHSRAAASPCIAFTQTVPAGTSHSTNKQCHSKRKCGIIWQDPILIDIYIVRLIHLYI